MLLGMGRILFWLECSFFAVYSLVVVVVSMLLINLRGCIRFDLSFLFNTLTRVTMYLPRLMVV